MRPPCMRAPSPYHALPLPEAGPLGPSVRLLTWIGLAKLGQHVQCASQSSPGPAPLRIHASQRVKAGRRHVAGRVVARAGCLCCCALLCRCAVTTTCKPVRVRCLSASLHEGLVSRSGRERARTGPLVHWTAAVTRSIAAQHRHCCPHRRPRRRALRRCSIAMLHTDV